MFERIMRSALRQYRRFISESLHLVLTAVALTAAFLLRFEFTLDAEYRAMLWHALPIAIVLKFVIFRAYSLRDLAWRYLSFEDLLRIIWANTVASLATAGALRLAVGLAFPRSIYILDLILSISLLSLARALARVCLNFPRISLIRRSGSAARRILIYGAGQAGRRVLTELREQPGLSTEAVGFLDDDAGKRHLRMNGLRVLGGRAALPELIRKHGVNEVWLALPMASGGEVAAILEECHAAGIATKRIPPLAELTEDRVLLDQLREVRIEDLLGRPPVDLGQCAMRESLAGKIVLVTGAGGSIGSELCRQIARANPRVLIGIDHGETALYQIDQEMREQFPGVVFCPEIANIQNRKRLHEIFDHHRPNRVYHAAAYKHVPMMEAHFFEAIENNVFGTFNVVKASIDHHVEAFVLISSDKAVRPANIMGATKRLAELICLAGQQSPAVTRFLAVRFGNVLGSNGSVIPLFRRQIAAGGPLTVTHPEMRRYFMTIPEAVQLVLEAAELGSGGEIFVLDMGEPVRILDLARKLVLLSGLRPGKDIRIEFSGIRPGEKVYEELHLDSEETLATPHAKIRVYGERRYGYTDAGGAGNSARDEWTHHMAALRRLVAARDLAGTLLCCKEMIPDYSPSADLLRRAFEANENSASQQERSNKTTIYRRAANA